MGTLICVHGPSQAGKNTLIARYLEEFPQAVRLVTATSRPPRAGERNGVDKFFLPRNFFDEHKDEFFETVEEHSNFYGIMKEPLFVALENHPLVFADLDMCGVRTLMQQSIGHPVFALFVCPDTFAEIEQRVLRKGDANAQVRIQTARQEWRYKDDPLFSAVISTSCSIDESYALFKQAVQKLTKNV